MQNNQNKVSYAHFCYVREHSCLAGCERLYSLSELFRSSVSGLAIALILLPSYISPAWAGWLPFFHHKSKVDNAVTMPSVTNVPTVPFGQPTTIINNTRSKNSLYPCTNYGCAPKQRNVSPTCDHVFVPKQVNVGPTCDHVFVPKQVNVGPTCDPVFVP